MTPTNPIYHRARRCAPSVNIGLRALGAAAALALLAVGCAPAQRATGRRPAATGPAERNIVFPIAREVSFSDTFGAPRGGGTRSHQGQDLMAAKMTPLVATVDGTIRWVRWSNSGNAGNMLVLADEEGWEYWYMHINNDSPGTDDGANRYDQAFADGIRAGQRVKAGEVIAWIGDSGNAESTSSHVHFEMHRPDGTVINPFNTIARARLRVRSAAQTANDSPSGNLEAVLRSNGTVTARGWGLDAHRNEPVVATVYVNGNPVTSALADDPRPDVAAVHPGRGTRHGFAVAGARASGGDRVCVVLHSIGGGGNTRLPCRTAPPGG